MKVYQANEIKNISLMGSSGSGKTTLVEAMLYESGVIKRRGTVEAKNTVSDYFPVEQEYGYSVFPTVIHAEWLGKKLNIIDCPGNDDFIGGTITSLEVTDQAVILLNTQYGVEVGTQNHFRYTEKHHKPVIFLCNQLDTEKSDFNKTVEQLRESFGSKVVLVQYPLNVGPDFNAVIDVLLMKMYRWKPEGGAPEILPIPESEQEKAADLHQKLIEAAAENDETLMDKYFEQGSLSEDEMRAGIRKGLVGRDIFPVFCVCSGRSMGVRRLMEFLGNVVPFVTDMPKPMTTAGVEVAPDPNGPTSLFVFKTSVEPHIGEVSYFKVMSGTLRAGDDLTNVSRNEGKERISQIYSVSGQNREEVEQLVAGDIGATVKLKDTRTGNTLNGKGCDYVFPLVKYPDPKYRRAIRPQAHGEEEKLNMILTRMHEEDPTWIIEQSKELKQTIVHGQGEFHLRTLKWRIENNDKLPIVYDEPKIPYRETITKASRADYRHKKQSGGAGQFGEVHLIVEPYTEDMPVAPNTVYGKTKLAGEQALLEVCSRALIIRTAWLYSGFGNNFVKTMLRLGAERDHLNVVFDQIGTPTYAADLAEAILQILSADKFVPGIYHFTNEGVCSWYDFTTMIFRLAQVQCTVSPIESKDYAYRTPRPHYSVLNKAKIKTVYGIEIPYWVDALERCLQVLCPTGGAD